MPLFVTALEGLAALTRLTDRDTPFYAAVWNGLTVIQQRTLLAVLTEGGRELQTRRVTAKYGIAAPSLRHSLLALEARDILRRYELSSEALGFLITAARQFDLTYSYLRIEYL